MVRNQVRPDTGNKAVDELIHRLNHKGYHVASYRLTQQPTRVMLRFKLWEAPPGRGTRDYRNGVPGFSPYGEYGNTTPTLGYGTMAEYIEGLPDAVA